ncbi:hypothetical protein GWJ21_13055 [Bacillus coagulans]|uniref:Uncharacterized protein n=1 Tax=Heyndrickxia coagulans TaxID=1398 RepID=A0A150KFK4_HEYCO|nr:hypothetical protein [Heyndrickxia coagulans]KYC70405.1 hypothetical protein B4099_1092 [Heyndrickxia coagulans]NCG68827.1 hypothetical protein [Heyndrickxia coagulans]RGR82761.1 hypothetical protein DWY22_11005 [Heyndrickxia coagulans]RGR98322.1 hypothetical protein DWY16_07905 [Heyndrickxia coagulans]
MAHLFVTMNAFQDTAIFSYPVLFAAIREAGCDGVEIRRELRSLLVRQSARQVTLCLRQER